MSEKLKAGWIGMGGGSFLLTEILRETIERAGYSLHIMSEWDYPPASPFHHAKWSRDTWLDFMLSMDVILCPARHEIQCAKSNIKATQAMALGLPVIASPLFAYREIVRHGENGFIADIHNLDDWYQALVALKDEETRKRIGAAGKVSVAGYSLDAITDQWEDLFKFLLRPDFKSLAITPAKVSMPEAVDLVVATYNNLEYIKLTIASILLNTSGFRLIVSDAGSGPDVWEYLRTLQGVTVLGAPGVRLNYSEACNAGIRAGTGKYVCIMNSDLVLSKGWLAAMVDKMEAQPRLAACNPLSNCDSGWLWNAAEKPLIDMFIKVGKVEDTTQVMRLRPGMTMPQISPHLSALYSFMDRSNQEHKGQYHSQPWVAAYCTLYARTALAEIGLFDPIYRNGCEDLDLCRRIRAAGYEIGVAMDSFVFHFGGISRGAYQIEDKAKYDAEDVRNHEIYRQKWAKKKIAIWTGPGWEKWDRSTVDAGMAGSETWAAELAAEFSRRGYQVLLFGDPTHAHLDRDGIAYIPHEQMEDQLAFDYVDAFIASRSCEPLKMKIHSGQNFVMIHDVFISANPGYDIMDWAVKKYAYLSEWHKEFLLSHHRGMKPEKMFLSMNGVNAAAYAEVRSTWNDTNKLHEFRGKKNQTIYSSSPDRGLKALLQILPVIRKAVPDFIVKVAYGFHNWEAAARARNSGAELIEIEAIKKLMDQPGVEYLGRIDKASLARHQIESKVWLFPTWFTETFCITAVENALAGNALVSSNLAGLRSTVGGSGILIDGFGSYGGPHSKEYIDKFIQTAIMLLSDPYCLHRHQNAAHKGLSRFTWESCADGWLREFGWT